MDGYTVGSTGLVPEYINRVLGLGRNDTFTTETSEILKQYQRAYYNSYPEITEDTDTSSSATETSDQEEIYIVANGIADIYTLPILCEIQLDPDNAYTIATAQFAMNVLDDKGDLMVTGYYDNYPLELPENDESTTYGSGGDWVFTIDNSDPSNPIISSICPSFSHTKAAIWNFQLKYKIGTSGAVYNVTGSFQTENDLNNACTTWENSWAKDDQGNPIRVPATVNGVLMKSGGFYKVESDNHIEALVHIQDSSSGLYYQHIKVSIPEEMLHTPTGYVDIPTWNKMRTVYGAGGI